MGESRCSQQEIVPAAFLCLRIVSEKAVPERTHQTLQTALLNLPANPKSGIGGKPTPLPCVRLASYSSLKVSWRLVEVAARRHLRN